MIRSVGHAEMRYKSVIFIKCSAVSKIQAFHSSQYVYNRDKCKHTVKVANRPNTPPPMCQ